MITLFCGLESEQKSHRVLEMIKASAESGRKVCVIVPEQQAVVWERRLAKALDPKTSLNLDVVSFTRLANLVERRYGGLSYNYADRGARTLLMWKAVSTCAPLLKVYGSARNTANIVSAMQAAQSEFARCSVTPHDLSNAAEILAKEGEVTLADRLSDLAVVMAEYASSFDGKYDDPGTEADKLLALLREHTFFADTDVFIDSFYSLTTVETKIAREIFSQAANTVMTFACPNKLPDGSPHLEHIHEFYRSMKEYANRFGISTVEEVSSTNDEGPREYLCENLWNYGAEPYSGSAEGFLTLTQCSDRYDEAEAALCRVRELVSTGARYSDIAIVTRSMEGKIGTVDTAFADAGIPLSVSVRFSLMDSPLVSFALHALGAIRSDYDRDEVCDLVKSAMTDITDDEASAFNRYTKVWNISGKHAYSNGQWTMNPDGYASELSLRARRELDLANSAKAKIEHILAPLADVFDGGAKVENILTALWETLSRSGAYTRLRERAVSLHALGYKDASAFLRRSWDELMASLDTFAQVLGDMETDAATFCSLLRQVIAARDVGVIPSGIDEVAFGAADRLRLDRVSHVIILGAVEGEFPQTPDESGIFTDSDRVRMEGAGLILSDKAESRASQELFWFWRACAMAEKTLDIIIPETDASSKTQPSSGARRISELFPRANSRYFLPDDPDMALWRREEAGRFLDYADAENPDAARAIRALAPDADYEGASTPMWTSVSKEIAERIFGRNIITTQSRLEHFTKCAFSYYCRYVLKLDEREETHLSPVDVGNFVHSILEQYFSRENVWELDSDEQSKLVKDLTSAYVEKIFGDTAPPRLQYLAGRLEKSVLLFCKTMSEEFAQSEFRPFALEQKIGMGENTPPPYDVPLADGTSVRVRGIIDRLDVMRKDDRAYVRVVDYKTGSKKLSESDIRLGLNTQLFLYLFAVWHCPDCDFRTRLLDGAKEIVPASAMYFSARPGETFANGAVDDGTELAKESVVRSGRFLADGEILRAMERDLAGKYIPVKELKNGTFTKTTAIPAEGFDELRETVTSAVAKIADGMKNGSTDALPLKHGNNLPCDYCSMMPICRNTAANVENTDQERK